MIKFIFTVLLLITTIGGLFTFFVCKIIENFRNNDDYYFLYYLYFFKNTNDFIIFNIFYSSNL